MKKANPALSSIIVGALMNIINIIFIAILVFANRIYSSLYLIIGSIAGIISAIQGLRTGQGIWAIAGLILNIIALIGSVMLLLIYIVA